MVVNSALLEKASGFQGSELIVICSTPGKGKTFLALTMAKQLIFDLLKPVAFVSLELSKDALLKRLLKIDDLSAEDIQDVPLYILDTPQMTILELEKHIRKAYNEKKIEAAFIDYLGLLHNGNKEQAAHLIKIKTLTAELKIPVFVVCQLTSLQTLQSLYTDEAYQCVDKFLYLEGKSELTFSKRSTNNDWINEKIQWSLPLTALIF